MAGLPLDGGKIVLIGDPKTAKTPQFLESYGKKLRLLAGRFITGEDVNISMSDADAIAAFANTTLPSGKESITIAGLSLKGGDPSPVTARGVLSGIQVCLQHVYDSNSFEGRTILVQGVGKVGYALAELVIQAGGRALLSDISPEPMKRLRRQYRGSVEILPSPLDDEYAAYRTPCDVFAPCAAGAVLNARTIPMLSCKIIAGSANNQLETSGDGYALHRRGIVYAPDYVINAGGLINVYDETLPGGYNRDRVFQQVDAIASRIVNIIDTSNESGISTHKVADTLATQIIGP